MSRGHFVMCLTFLAAVCGTGQSVFAQSNSPLRESFGIPGYSTNGNDDGFGLSAGNTATGTRSAASRPGTNTQPGNSAAGRRQPNSGTGRIEPPQTTDPFTNPDQRRSTMALSRWPDPPGRTQRRTRRVRRTVTDTPFEPLGIRSGYMIIRPGLEVNGVYSDNINQALRGKIDDFGLRLTPELRIESDWARHAFTFDGEGEFTLFLDNSDFNDIDASAQTGLRIDIRRTTTLDLSAFYSISQSSASSSDVPNAATSDRVDQSFGGGIALAHQFARITPTISAGVGRFLFSDVDLVGGGTENNSDRNYIEVTTGLRLAYEHTNAVQPFIDFEVSPRIRDEEVDRNGLRRDSFGIELTVGIETELSPIWSGQAGIKYALRDYEDATLDTVDGFGPDINMTWRPTPLTTVIFGAGFGLEETERTGISGVREYTGDLGVRHFLRDNLAVNIEGEIEFEDYVGTGEDDLTFEADISLSYYIKRGLELVAGYEFEHLHSWTPGSGYTEHRARAGFRFRL